MRSPHLEHAAEQLHELRGEGLVLEVLLQRVLDELRGRSDVRTVDDPSSDGSLRSYYEGGVLLCGGQQAHLHGREAGVGAGHADLAVDELEEHDAEAPDVDGRSLVPSRFGRAGGARWLSVDLRGLETLRSADLSELSFFVEERGEPEVDELDLVPSLVQQHVLGLKIAVADLFAVAVRHRLQGTRSK